MAEAKKGDIVLVHYTGKLADGKVFDTSKERHPLKFTIGNGQVIAGFEQAIIGMSPGDSKTVRIPPAEAYGDHRKDLVITFSRSQLPQGMNPKVGQRLELTQENDQTALVTIVGVTDTDLMLDANHPLAGKELTFDLQLGTIEE